MKKLLAFILLLVYFTVSTGFVISVHYCMNRVDSVQLGDTSSEKCGKCGMHIEKSDGCCKDDVKMVKMQVDQAFAKLVSPDFSYHALLPQKESFEQQVAFVLVSVAHPLPNGPPLNGQDTYLQNCVFRL